MHAYVLWIAALSYALHVVEEYTFDWKTWATEVLHLPVSWTHFALVNGVVVILGVACSSVGWALPAFSLSLPALMLINAIFMHMLPFVRTRGRFSPGLGTAVVLFIPVALWAYHGAYLDGVLTVQIAALSILIGIAELASPIVMLKLRLLPYFKQS